MCTSLTNEVPVILREIEKFTQTFYIAHVEFGSMTGLGNFFNTAGPNCLESVLNLAITDVMMIDQDDLAILMELRNLPNLISLGFRKKHSGDYRDAGRHEGKHFARKVFKFAHSWLTEGLENGKEMDFFKTRLWIEAPQILRYRLYNPARPLFRDDTIFYDEMVRLLRLPAYNPMNEATW